LNTAANTIQSPHRARQWFRAILIGWICVLFLVQAGCSARNRTSPPSIPNPPMIILYDWADDIPNDVLDGFTQETHIKVKLVTYESTEEAYQYILDGISYDVAVVESEKLPNLVDSQALAPLDKSHIENSKNISPDFRDLVYDPDHHYSLPYSWGTTGLLVKTDQVGFSVQRWADLWNPILYRKVMARQQQIELISVALKALGYPLNSQDPQQLDAAYQKLVRLKPGLIFASTDSDEAVREFLDSGAVVMVGRPADALMATRENPKVTYVLPEEGSMLWSDNFVVSAYSPNREAAEDFINYLLRPEVNALIVNAKNYSSANEAAHTFIHSDILSNPILYPPLTDIARSEWYMPLDTKGLALYQTVWNRFLAER
jgi:spermidine/putrescine transport system substrate-binding protein